MRRLRLMQPGMTGQSHEENREEMLEKGVRAIRDLAELATTDADLCTALLIEASGDDERFNAWDVFHALDLLFDVMKHFSPGVENPLVVKVEAGPGAAPAPNIVAFRRPPPGDEPDPPAAG